MMAHPHAYLESLVPLIITLLVYYTQGLLNKHEKNKKSEVEEEVGVVRLHNLFTYHTCVCENRRIRIVSIPHILFLVVIFYTRAQDVMGGEVEGEEAKVRRKEG